MTLPSSPISRFYHHPRAKDVIDDDLSHEGAGIRQIRLHFRLIRLILLEIDPVSKFEDPNPPHIRAIRRQTSDIIIFVDHDQ
jgi:hypothetical protein